MPGEQDPLTRSCAWRWKWWSTRLFRPLLPLGTPPLSGLPQPRAFAHRTRWTWASGNPWPARKVRRPSDGRPAWCFLIPRRASLPFDLSWAPRTCPWSRGARSRGPEPPSHGSERRSWTSSPNAPSSWLWRWFDGCHRRGGCSLGRRCSSTCS